MKIKDLKDKQGKIDIDLKIIWNQSKPKEMFGKQIQTILVADAESEKGDPTAYFDLYNADIDTFKHLNKIRVTNAYAKLVQNNSGQFRLVNYDKIELIE